MMCVVVRANDGVDWRNGLDLSQPIGDDYEIESHHIFPRAQLRDAGYDTNTSHHDKKRVNEIANRIPMTRSGNLDIFDSPPADYLPTVEDEYPEALEPALIPLDRDLWRMANYERFLAERRELIADGINGYMRSLVSRDFVVGETGVESRVSERGD
jgi:hypothetical protein